MASDIRESAGVSHRWQPIAPLGETGYDFQEITSLQREWLRIKAEVERDTPQAYAEFTAQLTRRWAIETGIIEGVYELDRGVTETLIQKGFAADYIERGSTNREPSELTAILRDHQDAVASVNNWIEEGRPLTKWFICALHSQILNNQHTSRAINQFGNSFDATLVKGEFKKQPNNPTKTEGITHEYCPPEQVNSEIERLLRLYDEYSADTDCHPLLLAAWQHHRFQQIHPFQDGNGRVGRAILTWHLVKNGFFPIVVSRDDRAKYIYALERADDGDLTPLIDMFVRLEKHTILQALDAGDAAISSAPEFPQADLIGEVVGGIVERVKRRRQSEEKQKEEQRFINNIALELRRQTQDYLQQKSQEIQEQLAAADIHVTPRIEEGGPDKNNEHLYRLKMLRVTNHSQHQASISGPIYFVKLVLEPESLDLMTRLVFVILIYRTGERLAGIMAATAFAQIEQQDDEESDFTVSQDMSNFAKSFRNCAADPFTFTWSDPVDDISDRLTNWTEACFGVALRYWMDNF